MSLVSVVCFGIAGLIILRDMRRDADIFSPGLLFLLVWSIAIGLTDLKFSALQREWSVYSWLCVLLGPLSLLTGILVMKVLFMNSPVLPLDRVRVEWRSSKINVERLFVVVCSVFAFYAIGYLVIYLYRGFIPLFSPHGAAFRGEFALFGVGVSVQSMPLVVFFTAVYLLVEKGHRVRKTLLVIMSLISVVTFLFLLQRFQIMMTALMCVALVYYATRSIRFSTALACFAVAVLFFYWLSGVRGGQELMRFLYLDSKMKFPPAYAFLTEPYMYVVMNVENLAHSVEAIDRYTYGLFTFEYLTAIVGFKHWTREYFMLEDLPYLISPYNTYTAFWTYYRDFGVFGLAGIPFVLGLISGATHQSLRRTPTVTTMTAYSAIVFVLVISFFNSPISLLWFMWEVFGMFVILRLISIDPSGRQPVVATSP